MQPCNALDASHRTRGANWELIESEQHWQKVARRKWLPEKNPADNPHKFLCLMTEIEWGSGSTTEFAYIEDLRGALELMEAAERLAGRAALAQGEESDAK